MKSLMMTALMLGILSSSAVMAKSHTNKPATTTVTRMEKARRQIAFDLHRRGSNIPPAFSADGRWSR